MSISNLVVHPEERGLHLSQLRERSQNLVDLSPGSGRDALRRVLNRAPGQDGARPYRVLADRRPPVLRVAPGDKVRDFAELVVVAIYALAVFAEIAMLIPAV